MLLRRILLCLGLLVVSSSVIAVEEVQSRIVFFVIRQKQAKIVDAFHLDADFGLLVNLPAGFVETSQIRWQLGVA